MFVVILFIFLGIGIGLNPDMKNDIKSLNPRLALLPLATILGSWMGAMAAYLLMSNDVCSILHHRSLTDFTVPFLVTMWCTI